MPEYIDRVAWLEIKDNKLLMTQSIGKDAWYLPGGKREADESDEQTLIREVKEELSVAIKPASIRRYGTFTGPAHGKPEGTMVRVTLYTADYEGTPSPSNEIAQAKYLPSTQKIEVAHTARLLFDDLKQKGLIE